MQGNYSEGVCAACGATFPVRRADRPQRYCSRACANRTRAKPKVEITCRGCGRVFLAFPYQVGQRWSCSLTCRRYPPPVRATRGGKLMVQCRQCGVGFVLWRFRVREDGLYYCSRACQGAGYRAPRPVRACAICGARFTPQKSQVDAGQGRFCSRACAAIGRTNPTNVGRSGWRYRQWRAAVLRRDGNTCQRCGATGTGMHAHHLKSWWRFVSLRFEVSNGVTVCEPCHDGLHSSSKAGGAPFGTNKGLHPA